MSGVRVPLSLPNFRVFARIRSSAILCARWQRLLGANGSMRPVRGHRAPKGDSVSRRQIGDDLSSPNSLLTAHARPTPFSRAQRLIGGPQRGRLARCSVWDVQDGRGVTEVRSPLPWLPLPSAPPGHSQTPRTVQSFHPAARSRSPRFWPARLAGGQCGRSRSRAYR